MSQEENMMRKGPWTEQEDVQLVLYVNTLGDRRWDFLAKVSGLKRSGKSCRLRWVNYLQPGLKRGKITPQEQRLILQLHSKFGNRWSKIAQKLPGRTDNEIKNYWRTHMRKKANKERTIKCTSSSSPSLSSLSNSCSYSGDDDGGRAAINSAPSSSSERLESPMTAAADDDIWKDVELWAEDEAPLMVINQNNYWSDWDWINMDCYYH